MASSAPHPLAEAICELAAPPVSPTLLLLRPLYQYYESFALLLHVRPRGSLSAGVEVAVQCGIHTDSPQGDQVTAAAAAQRYVLDPPPGLPPSASVDAFVSDLLAAGGWNCYWEEYAEPCGLQLAAEPPLFGSTGWSCILLTLLDASDVRVAPAPPARGHAMVTLSFPPYPEPCLCTSELSAASYWYKSGQDRLKAAARQAAQAAAAAAAAGGAEGGAAEAGAAAGPAAAGTAAAASSTSAAEPDSEEVFRQKWRELRDRDHSQLAAHLAAMLRLACRYRGRSSIQLSADAVPPAGAGT